MALSSQQQAVVQWVREGKGSATVRARAGTGKTTLLIAALAQMTGKVAIAAYNTKISKEIAGKVAARGLNATVGTFHKFGFDAWRFANKDVKIEGTGARNAGYKKFDRIVEELQIPQHYRAFVRSAVSLAKQRGFGVLVGFNDPQQWLALVEHFDLDAELAEDAGAIEFLNREELIKQGLRHACKALKRSIEIAHEVIDFDDMLYMPLVANCRVFQYDWVLVDEAQDTNPVRRALAKKMLRPGGRAIFVGDDRQAIYGFTGADNDALDVISREFGTLEFPLTVTFRCPKAVVAEAQKLVPDYQAADAAAEGEYSIISEEAFGALDLQVTDAVICRNTKPLIDIAYGLIKRGIACHVEGREIGAGLIKLVTRWERIKTLPALVAKLEEFRDREVSKLLAKGKEEQAEAVEDRVDTISAIISGLPQGATLADLKAKINSMFSDSDGERAPSVTLLTAHRSKGLEYDRVFLFGRNRYMPSKYARQDWQLAQERNLEYVALTRAMKSLVEVEVSAPTVARHAA